MNAASVGRPAPAVVAIAGLAAPQTDAIGPFLPNRMSAIPMAIWGVADVPRTAENRRS